jgi:superfamily II DNA or RNA helicase
MSSLYSRLKDGYQKRVVDTNVELIGQILRGEKKNIGRQITVSPTGSGKTFMMASVIEVGLRLPEEPCFIWLTHNKQIMFQTENEVMESLGAYTTTVYNIEQGIESYGGRILLFNVQKGVSPKAKVWLAKWSQFQKDQNRPVVFIVDEADEGMSGKNMDNIRDVLTPVLELGFTGSFKKKQNEFEYQRVSYKEVIEAGMLIQNIEYQASDEVDRIEMMKRAIQQRDYLEKCAESLKAIDRYFVPKLLIQAPARECEGVARELQKELNISKELAQKYIVVHTQDSRGLDEMGDISEVRYIIGDLMVERGWNCPEAYVLLSTKDSVSVAKGIQLLGRVIRMPKTEPFDERFNMFNTAYVYIAGQHSIVESCRNFTGDGVSLPPPKEVVQVEKRTEIKVPKIITFIDELDKDIDDRDLFPITDSICDVIEQLRIKSHKAQPSMDEGVYKINDGAVKSVSTQINSEWNLEQTKKIIIDALAKHYPRNYANLVATKYQIQLKPQGGLNLVAPYSKQLAQEIRENASLRKIAQTLDFVYKPYEFPTHKLVIAQPTPFTFERSLYPKIQLNNEEKIFASWLDEIAKKNDLYWVRNEVGDVKFFRGHSPDFILFNKDNYVFFEFKGGHLLNTPDTLRKNTVGQSAGDYFMVYLAEDKESFIQQGWAGEKDQELTEIDVLTPLKKKSKTA